ncbi:MAG: Rpp14/Pop5 family protein [Candidatus Bathyarchaeia archaeon]
MVKIDSEKIPCKKDFEHTLWYNIIRLFGEYGASLADLSLIEYNQEIGYAIIRCSHIALPMVRATIAAITKINNKETVVHTISASGTLKALKKRIIIFGSKEK